MTGRLPTPSDEVVIRAWRRAGGPAPSAVEPLGKRRSRGNKKSVLYRLLGAGDRGAAVVAKLCRGQNAAHERRIYEKVLPALSIPLPRFYGAREEPEGIWLFLEDGGATRCDRANPAHRLAAARWLARLHAAASRAALGELPDRGPAHYLECLRSGRRAIVENRENPAFEEAHRALLDSLVARCGELEARWGEIEAACASLPRTLVHGDFCVKNLHVRAGAEGLELFAMDWEMAGWGVPAADLYPSRHPKPPIADLGEYGALMRQSWPDLDAAPLRRLLGLGRVFRNLAGMDWIGADLPLPYPETPISMLRIYRDELAVALREPEWAA